jgi:glycerol dehydrogenase-like iron-containing ADH family enzyme
MSPPGISRRGLTCSITGTPASLFAAGFGTVVATLIIARRQIVASREEADKVIAATRAQTEVTAKQTETTVRLEKDRVASEARAFRAMLEAR